jgi:hypothetical protein
VNYATGNPRGRPKGGFSLNPGKNAIWKKRYRINRILREPGYKDQLAVYQQLYQLERKENDVD